jgi:hypothetical protein
LFRRLSEQRIAESCRLFAIGYSLPALVKVVTMSLKVTHKRMNIVAGQEARGKGGSDSDLSPLAPRLAPISMFKGRMP